MCFLMFSDSSSDSQESSWKEAEYYNYTSAPLPNMEQPAKRHTPKKTSKNVMRRKNMTLFYSASASAGDTGKAGNIVAGKAGRQDRHEEPRTGMTYRNACIYGEPHEQRQQQQLTTTAAQHYEEGGEAGEKPQEISSKVVPNQPHNPSSSKTLNATCNNDNKESKSFVLKPNAQNRIAFSLHKPTPYHKRFEDDQSQSKSLDSSPDPGGRSVNTSYGFSGESSSLDSSPFRSSQQAKNVSAREKVYGKFEPVVNSDSATNNMEEAVATSSPKTPKATDLDWFSDPTSAEKNNKKIRKVSLPSTKKTRWSKRESDSFKPWTPSPTTPTASDNVKKSGTPTSSGESYSLLPQHLQRLCWRKSTSPSEGNLGQVRWQNSKQKFAKRYTGVREPYIDSHCHLDFLFDR